MSDDKPSRKPARRRRGAWWQIALIVVLAAGAFYAYAERPWEPKPAAVRVEQLAIGPFAQVLAVNGRVVAREVVSVRPPVSAQVVEVLVREGDAVADGDVLVRLDAAQSLTLVDQAQAALEAGIVSRTQAQANADRAVALGDNVARSSRENAELALSAASREVERLQAALAEANSQLSQYTIIAPLGGVILERNVDRGQLVDPQSELFTIANLNELEVATDVDELYSARIRTNLGALLKPVGDTVAQHGHIVFASPTVDPSTGGRAIRIAFDNPVELPVGLTVNANIIVAEMEAALTVPRGAIVTEGTESHVMVLQNGIARVRPIVLSDWPADRVVVLEGLAAGDLVILEPSSVADGDLAVVE
ncbi:MAG: efflux RND transporter periplasmic adaptor subunit [Devosia sp.]|nr:efflux RND transporter periplasmic adaptor subunit [Devosia sp.]